MPMAVSNHSTQLCSRKRRSSHAAAFEPASARKKENRPLITHDRLLTGLSIFSDSSIRPPEISDTAGQRHIFAASFGDREIRRQYRFM